MNFGEKPNINHTHKPGQERRVCMRVTLLSVIMILTLLASMALASDESTNQPVIFMEKLVNDLGNIFEQKSYKYTFKVENKGKADLLIESVKPG
jgi:hypothetical protein